MECPICGSDCENLNVEIVMHEADFDDVAEYVFKKLIDKGYVVNYDDINMILDIVQEYMVNEDVINDDEETSS
jgi:hypothetical protein